MKKVLLVYTHSMTTIYLSLSAQVAISTFFMKSPLPVHVYGEEGPEYLAVLDQEVTEPGEGLIHTPRLDKAFKSRPYSLKRKQLSLMGVKVNEIQQA